MDEEREMVLRMLKEGKVTVEEADALLQELVEQRWEDEGGSTTAPPPPSSPGVPDVREELRTVFQDLMDSIPKDVVRELKHAREAFRPGFFDVIRGLRGLAEGRAETTAEEAMSAGDQVILRNAWGDVALAPSPDGRLRVRAIKRVWAETAEDAQREAEALPCEVRRQGTSIEISVQRPTRRHQRSRVDFHLAVPADVDVCLDVSKGDVEAEALRGKIDLRIARGDVKIRGHEGPAELDVVSGDIEVGLPASARATIDASTRSGSIHSALTLRQTTGDRRSLRGILNAPGATVRLSATSGDIEIGESRR